MHGRWAMGPLEARKTIWEVLESEGGMDGRRDGRMTVAEGSLWKDANIGGSMESTSPGHYQLLDERASYTPHTAARALNDGHTLY